MTSYIAIIRRDITLAFRAGGGALQAVTFFALATLIFTLAIGPDLALLSRIAPAIVWACTLLSTLVSLDRIFQADLEDGSLDALVETSTFLEITVIAKAAAHWMNTCVPLLLAAPILGLLLNLERAAYAPLLLSLIIGTPGLSLIGALGAALTLAMRRSAILLSVLIAPLYIPVVIFGVASAEAGRIGAAFWPPLMILGAISLFALIVAPAASAAAIRANLS